MIARLVQLIMIRVNISGIKGAAFSLPVIFESAFVVYSHVLRQIVGQWGL